jgi:hypothetical protein
MIEQIRRLSSPRGYNRQGSSLSETGCDQIDVDRQLHPAVHSRQLEAAYALFLSREFEHHKPSWVIRGFANENFEAAKRSTLWSEPTVQRCDLGRFFGDLDADYSATFRVSRTIDGMSVRVKAFGQSGLAALSNIGRKLRG